MRISKAMLAGASLLAVFAVAPACVAGSPSGDASARTASSLAVLASHTRQNAKISVMPGKSSGRTIIRVATLPECVDHGGTCVLNGTPCCDATDECKGKFPNTTCQAK